MNKVIEQIKTNANKSGMTVCGYICLPAAIVMGLVSLLVVIAVFALTDSETAMNISTAIMGVDMLVGFTGILAEVWDRVSCLF